MQTAKCSETLPKTMIFTQNEPKTMCHLRFRCQISFQKRLQSLANPTVPNKLKTWNLPRSPKDLQ